jgi:hypothetical protein
MVPVVNPLEFRTDGNDQKKPYRQNQLEDLGKEIHPVGLIEENTFLANR